KFLLSNFYFSKIIGSGGMAATILLFDDPEIDGTSIIAGNIVEFGQLAGLSIFLIYTILVQVDITGHFFRLHFTVLLQPEDLEIELDNFSSCSITIGILTPVSHI